MTLKPGDVVESLAVLVDKKVDGSSYIHAVPGTLGIVLDDDFTPEWPVIEWFGPMGFGTCNVDPSSFRLYEGRIVRVVD